MNQFLPASVCVRIAWATVSCFVLVACSAPPVAGPVDHRVKAGFDAMATARQNEAGTGMLTGTAHVVREGASVLGCAGSPVALFPVTPYASERVARIYGGAPDVGVTVTKSASKAAAQQIRFDPDPPEYRRFMRTTTCDARGQFQFKRLRDGDYYVFALLSWQQQPFEGQMLLTRVAVRHGRSPVVALSTSREAGS